ncbi:MAG: phasin family protein [Betaproteobacteria bacterium]|nr:phasin family protein [Betaproteobacteria bacterium]
MRETLEPFVATQKAGADVLLNLIRSSCNGLERLTALNMSAAREFLNSSVTNTQQILALKNPSDLSRLNLAQPALEKWLEYSREVYDLAVTLQKEVSNIAEGQYEQISKTASASLDKSAPGGDVLAATIQSFMKEYGRAFDQMNVFSRQASAIAEANLQAVTNATKATAAKTR